MATTIALNDAEKRQLADAINRPYESFDDYWSRTHPTPVTGPEKLLQDTNRRYAALHHQNHNSPLAVIDTLASQFSAQFRNLPAATKNSAEELQIDALGKNLTALAATYRTLAETGELDLKEARRLTFGTDMLRDARRRLDNVERRELPAEFSDLLREHVLQSFTTGTPITPDEVDTLSQRLEVFETQAREYEKEQRYESNEALPTWEQPARNLHRMARDAGEPAAEPVSEPQEKILRVLIRAMDIRHGHVRMTSTLDPETATQTARDILQGRPPSAEGAEYDFTEEALSQGIGRLRRMLGDYKEPHPNAERIGYIDRVLNDEQFTAATAMIDAKVRGATPGVSLAGDKPDKKDEA